MTHNWPLGEYNIAPGLVVTQHLYGGPVPDPSNPDGAFVMQEEVAWALNAEGIPCDTGYQAMNNYTLFQPRLSKLPVPSAFPEYFDFEKVKVPEATRACEHEALTVEESVFRAGAQGVDDFVSALKKVQENAAELRAAADKWRAEHRE